MGPQNDQWTIRAVVIVLGFVVAIATVGVILLAYQSKSVPSVIGYIVTTGLGALAAILASIRVASPTPPNPPAA